MQQHGAGLSRGRDGQWDEAEVGVGQYEFHGQLVGDTQFHAVAQGIDRFGDDAGLCQYGPVQYGPEAHAAADGHRFGRVLVRGTATNGAVMKVRTCLRAACCTWKKRWWMASTPVTTSIRSLMLFPVITARCSSAKVASACSATRTRLGAG
ncbi:hypothetical protein OHA98_25860 [Streptomyces sp. NBC_00654]|uniref:hypothetical protein n=1 Tax=Streptomyces sp. NBC_00654 TaxID=2975799 RepID=UPI00224E4F37|nr:hypothetical protein [Streptomyces sp. NBC_00654]MCX4968122.1 hypothetical protein [Streptomyces sp. NBC_00654]